MQTVDIVIINLARATDRRANIEAQFSGSGLNIDFLMGVDGINEANHPLFKKYDERFRTAYGGNPLSLGQLGCYASHYLAWQRCFNSNKPTIIIEDDAIVDIPKLKALIQASASLPSSMGCIRLFKNASKYGEKGAISCWSNNQLEIKKYKKGHMGAIGYYLTPKAASAFLDFSQSWRYEVDITMDRFWENQVECHGLLPICLRHNDDSVSTIDYQNINKKEKSLFIKLSKEISSFKDYLAREIHNIKFNAQK